MNSKLKLAAGLLAATLATSAHAGLVTQWGYNNQAGFLPGFQGSDNIPGNGDVTASGNSATGGNDPLTNNAGNILDTNGDLVVDATDNALYTSLQWGTPSNSASDPQSSLNIDSPATGTINTNDAAWSNGTNITHENWIIVGDSLSTATVLDGLSLTPTTWVGAGDPSIGAPYSAPQLAFGVNFYETPNGTTDINGNCPNGQPNHVGDNAGGCGDIFEITGLAALGITPVIGPNSIEFTVPFVIPVAGWDDTIYYVTTRLSGLSVLPAGYQCQGGGSCFGFVTKEKNTNILQAQFKISAPEPAAIALFGLGLIATGFASRRKRNI